jgi:hypothetical protein
MICSPSLRHPIRAMSGVRVAPTMVDVNLPWPVRSVMAGTAGTAAMTLSYATERRLRGVVGPLDYDDSIVPGEIVAGIMHLGNVSNREANELGLALRWIYGSAFGLWHGVLRRKIGEPRASIAFGATLMTATLTMFPLLGRTPPPWRWPASVIVTAFGTHAAYVGALAFVDDRVRRSSPPSDEVLAAQTDGDQLPATGV